MPGCSWVDGLGLLRRPSSTWNGDVAARPSFLATSLVVLASLLESLQLFMILGAMKVGSFTWKDEALRLFLAFPLGIVDLGFRTGLLCLLLVLVLLVHHWILILVMFLLGEGWPYVPPMATSNRCLAGGFQVLMLLASRQRLLAEVQGLGTKQLKHVLAPVLRDLLAELVHSDYSFSGPRASRKDDWWGHGASTWHDEGGQWVSAGTATERYDSWSWDDWWDYKNETTAGQDFTTEAWTEAPAQPVRRVSVASKWRGGSDEARDVPTAVVPPKGSPSESPKKRWRRRRGNTHQDDDRRGDQDTALHSWKLKRDVWQARAPLAFIETAKDMSELLDAAAGVSILAWTSNAEVAQELWDLAEGERADADGADCSLTLLYEASSEDAWSPDGTSDVTILPVPGTVLGKLQHRKFHMVTAGGDPPLLSTRTQGTFAVRKPPPSLQALRAQSVVMRFTADAAYGAIAWDELSKNPAKFARTWASQHGLRQGDILDAYGFAKRGGSRLSGLLRIRSEAMARKLWAASGSLAAGAVFFVDLTGEDFRDTIAAWAKDTVVVQWQKWEPSETFKEYHSKAAKNAPMGLVLGRGLGRRIGCKDPNYVAVPGLWRAKAINYGFSEVNDLLGDLGFSEITIHGRHKGRKSNDWTFKAVRADGQAMLQQHVDWGAGAQSDLVILKESARRGAHVDVKARTTPIAERRSITFADAPPKSNERKGQQQRKRAAAATSSPAGPSSPAVPSATVLNPSDAQNSRGQKRAGPEDEGKMNVDAETGNGPADAQHWSPAATLFENPGGGNCLFYSMAQCGFEGKSIDDVTHRQMRRFARRCLESFAADFEEIWKEGGAYNTLGRTTSDLTWQTFLEEVSASASWGGALELSAVARATSTRTWVYEKKDGSLRLIYPEGDGGFVLLQYDEEQQHWQAFRDADEK
ncbi:unnamed protein product, partial [Symbiodinium sp. CCMP2456]